MNDETLTGEHVTKDVAEFPLEAAHQLVTQIRKAYKANDLSQEVSTRGLISWGTAFSILQSLGVGTEESLAAGFHLAIEAKYYGQERTFIRNLFNAKFGTEPNIPNFKSADNEHPLAPMVRPFMDLGIPLWIHGPKGCGKSFMVKQVAEQLGRTMLRVQITNASVPQDLLGDHAASNGSTYFEYGPLPLAMQNGWILNIDEISSGPPDVQFVLHSVLEGNPLVLAAKQGEIITAKPGFAIMFTDNSVGLGEATEYVGTKSTNEAFRDRPLFLAVDYMPGKRECNIVNLELTRFRHEHKLVVDAQKSLATKPKVKSAKASTTPVDFDAVKRAASIVT